MKHLMTSCPDEHKEELAKLLAAAPEQAKGPLQNLISILLASGLNWSKVLTVITGELPTILAALGLPLPASVLTLIENIIAAALATKQTA